MPQKTRYGGIKGLFELGQVLGLEAQTGCHGMAPKFGN